MKKYFFLLGTWFVVIIGIIVGNAVYNKHKSSKYDNAAVPYLEKTVPQLSKWNADQIKQLMASEALNKIPEQKYKATIELFSKMGNLTSMEQPQFSQIHTGENGQTIIEYTINAIYEKGNALLTINLLHDDGQFAIYHFNVQSEALIGQ